MYWYALFVILVWWCFWLDSWHRDDLVAKIHKLSVFDIATFGLKVFLILGIASVALFPIVALFDPCRAM
jgi:hypothetical protein